MEAYYDLGPVPVDWFLDRYRERTYGLCVDVEQKRTGVDGTIEPFGLVGENFETFRLRNPGEDPLVEKWHRDAADGPKEDLRWMLLWANIYPTQLRDGAGRIDIPDGHMVLVDNQKLVHRRPAGIPRETERYFFRLTLQKVLVTPEKIEKWKKAFQLLNTLS